MVLLPLFAMVVGFALALVILNHYAGAPSRRLHELIWSISFFMFGLGALAEVVGDLAGWHDLLTRIYYISGAILAVTYLGVGEVILLTHGRFRSVALAVGILFTIATVWAVGFAPVDAAALQGATPWRAVAPPGSPPTLLAGLSNSLGTLLLVGGALYSAWIFWRKGIQRQRMIGCLLLALGTVVVAMGGVLAGWFGQHEWLYPPMAAGVAIMFVGYLQTTRAAVPGPAPSPPKSGKNNLLECRRKSAGRRADVNLPFR